MPFGSIPPPLQVTGFNSWQIPIACLTQAGQVSDAAIAVFAVPNRINQVLDPEKQPYNRPIAVTACHKEWSVIAVGAMRVGRIQDVLRGAGITSACIRRCPR